MTEPVFAIDTNRFSSISFSDSGRQHTPEYYDNLHLSSDERLLFQIMANPNLTTALFDTGKVLMGKDEFVATAHVIVSGEVDIAHPDGHFVVGPGAVIGLSEGLLGVKARCHATARSLVNTRMIPMDGALRSVAKTNTGLKGIFRCTIARIMHIDLFPAALK